MNKSRGPYIAAIQSSLHGVGIHCVEDWDFVSLTLTSSLLLKLLHISLVSMYTTVADFLLHVHPSKVDTITLSTRITINFKWTPYKFDAIYSYETFCILFQNWITIKWHNNICPLHSVSTVEDWNVEPILVHVYSEQPET